jgi:hypothetical protein
MLGHVGLDFVKLGDPQNLGIDVGISTISEVVLYCILEQIAFICSRIQYKTTAGLAAAILCFRCRSPSGHG